MKDKIQNQKERVLAMLQKDNPGYHPLISLAEIATDKDNDVKIRLDANKIIAPYVESQLKAVEVQGDLNADFGCLRVVLSTDEVIDDDDEETDTD